jgi:hypothetical protein
MAEAAAEALEPAPAFYLPTEGMPVIIPAAAAGALEEEAVRVCAKTNRVVEVGGLIAARLIILALEDPAMALQELMAEALEVRMQAAPAEPVLREEAEELEDLQEAVAEEAMAVPIVIFPNYPVVVAAGGGSLATMEHLLSLRVYLEEDREVLAVLEEEEEALVV